MICPKCGNKTDIIDSRNNTSNTIVRRRRECYNCGYRFTTYEIPSEQKGKLKESLKHLKEKLNDDLLLIAEISDIVK